MCAVSVVTCSAGHRIGWLVLAVRNVNLAFSAWTFMRVVGEVAEK